MAEHRFLEDLPVHALGALAGEELRRLEAHLSQGCDLCEAELFALREAAALLPHALPGRPLPAGLKAKVMGAIGGPRHVESGASPSPMIWGLAIAASLMLAAALGALWYTTRLDLSTLRSDNERLDSLLKEQEKEMAWLKDPVVQVALLRGLEGNPNAKAQLLWHPGTKQGILYVKGLPPLPLEKSYELWAFVDGQPVAAGTFDARPGDATVFNIPRQESFGEKPTKFAVSIEPKGGVPKPTGTIVLVGENL
jgi:hypothetical protein